MDGLSETIDIMLLPDMSKPYTALSNPLDSDASPRTRYNRRYKGSLKAPRTVKSRKSANRHIAF